MSNKYASKPFLNAQMASGLQYKFTQKAFNATTLPISWVGNFITVNPSDTDFEKIVLGSLLRINTMSGPTTVGVLAINSGTGALTVDLSSNSTISSLSVDEYTTTVQNALNVFLNDPYGAVSTDNSNAAYYALIASTVAALNATNLTNPTVGTNGKNGIRAFITGDDGTPIFDSGRATSAASNTNQITSLVSGSAPFLGNTYTNFSRKITIGSDLYSSNNTVTTVDNLVITTGTAGGNSINENHNSRPEFLGALFSPTGIAYSKRNSSTTKSLNYYIAQRVGISPEDPLGAIRLNVPITETL